MSEVTDWINSIGGPEAAYYALRADPAFRPLATAIKGPEDIPYVIQTMGWTTLAQVNAFIAQLHALGPQWADLVDPLPPIERKDLPTIPWTTFDTAVWDQMPRRDDYFRDHSDAVLPSATEAQLRALAMACPTHRLTYPPSNQHDDCDDAVRRARGWLAWHGLSGIAAEGWTTHYFGSQVQGGHVVLIVRAHDTGTVYQWEPQDGKLYPATHAKLGGFTLATSIKLARLIH